MSEDANAFTPASAMVIVAHPDDAEFTCAGTIAKWTRDGCEATYVVVTKGDKGSEDRSMTPARLAEIREAEQRAAGKILGVQHFAFLGYPDGYLQHTLDLRRDLARVIRQRRPEVVICFDPTARFIGDQFPNHPDHRASGDAAIDAVFPTARDHLTFPELMADGLEPHKVKELWLSPTNQANVWIDIEPTLALKKEALMAHPSQIGEDASDFAEQLARWSAGDQEFEFAESYRRIVIDRPSEVFNEGTNAPAK